VRSAVYPAASNPERSVVGTQTTTDPAATAAGRREWPAASQSLWIMDIYGFMIAGFLITMGTLGDRIGRRRLLMIGASAFGVASILAAYSTSAEMLIDTRALLGIARATLMPSTLALISNIFTNPHQRGVAIAVWMSSFMGGMTVGPLVGEVLLDNFWWGRRSRWGCRRWCCCWWPVRCCCPSTATPRPAGST
jgi:MFS family permease